MPNVIWPFRRGSARYDANTAPTAPSASPRAGRRRGSSSGSRASRAAARPGRRACRIRCGRASLRRGHRAHRAAGSDESARRRPSRRQASARRRFSSATEAIDSTSSGNPSAKAVVASTGPVHWGSTRRLNVGVEASQPHRPSQVVTEPLRRQVAHVVGLHGVVPHAHAQRPLHRVERHVQRQHAGRAQHHVVQTDGGPHQRQAGQLALRTESRPRHRPPSTGDPIPAPCRSAARGRPRRARTTSPGGRTVRQSRPCGGTSGAAIVPRSDTHPYNAA